MKDSVARRWPWPRRTRRSRRDQIADLKAAEAFRRQFLGNVAHELKTPIFNIQGYVSTLLDGGLEDELINRKYLERTAQSIERLSRIVGDLDTISRLESATTHLRKERFDVAELAREVAAELDLAAAARRVTLEVAPGTFRVFADRHYMGQVLMNLLSNSITYGREGGRTTVSFRETLDRVIVEVQDNGVGISAEHLPRIFERFYRTEISRARELGGTGLGLAIVKHIIEAHDEKITLSSALGVGTTFSFTIRKSDTL